MNRKTFLVNGRGFDVDSVDFDNLADADENESYYEVSGVCAKPKLLFSGPPKNHLRVLEHALSKWYEMGKIDEGMAMWPTDRIMEI